MPKTDKEVFRIKPPGWEAAETRIRRGFVSQPIGFSFYAFLFQSRRGHEWGEQWCLDVFTNGEHKLDAHPCASPEEGKQLVEQCWNEYVRQALEPVETNE